MFNNIINMLTKLFQLSLFVVMAFASQAQEAIFRASDLVSPEIGADSK
jgi:hypothetical protein